MTGGAAFYFNGSAPMSTSGYGWYLVIGLKVSHDGYITDTCQANGPTDAQSVFQSRHGYNFTAIFVVPQVGLCP